MHKCLWGQIFSFVFDTDIQAWECWVMLVIFCFVFEATTHFPKRLLHFAFFLSVRKCCMGVGFRGQLWVSILAFQFVWDRLPVVQHSHPRVADSEALSGCLVPSPMCHRGSETADVSYKIRLYVGTRDLNSVVSIAQRALYPLSHLFSLHYAFLPVIERVLMSL